MRDIDDKVNNDTAPLGVLQDFEWNDRNTELENAVIESGQALSLTIDNQLSRAIGNNGKTSTLASGTAEPGENVIVDNSGGAVTIDLPLTPETNTLVHFEQLPDSPYSANNLTVGRNGETIMGLAEDMTVGVSGGNKTNDIIFTMRFDGTTWRVRLTDTLGTTL